MSAPNEILAAIGAIQGIATLVLFGSRATECPRADSDLDVAVLPDDDQVDRRRLQSRIAAELSRLSPTGRVDVVFLDEAPVLLRQRIMETGQVILGDDAAAWRDLRVKTMREYHDSEWARRLLRQAQLRRLRKDGRSGRSGRTLESLGRVGKLPR